MSSWLERHIEKKMEDARDDTLAATKDTFDLAVARYRAYKDLLNDIADRKKIDTTGDADDND